jgi:putative transposase
MPKKLRRYYGRGELHFVTFSCYRCLPLLATTYARNLFVKELDEVRHGCDFLLVGYVLMPNCVASCAGLAVEWLGVLLPE